MLKHYTRRSLKAKLAFWSAAAMVLVVLAVTSFAVWVLRSDMARTAADVQSALVDSIARDLDARITDRRNALSQSAAVLGGELLVDSAALRDHFASRPVVQGMFDAMLVVDRHGRIVFDSPEFAGRVGKVVADRDYFKDVMSTGRLVISQPLSGRATTEPNIVFAAPLRNAAGETVGALCGLLYLSRPNFLTHLASVKVGKSGYVAVIAKSDQPVIVMHAHRDRVMTPVPPPSQSPLVHRALAGAEGTFQGVNSAGLEALFSFRMLKSVPWLITTAYPTAEAYAEIRSSERLVVVLGLALMVLAGLGIWLLVDHLLAPLDRLRAAMVESRDRTEPVVVNVRDETRELYEVVEAYNTLMAHKREAREALQRGEERLRLITDNLPAQIVYIDEAERYTFVNAQVGRELNVPSASLVGRPVREVRGEAIHAQILPHLKAAMRGATVTFEGEFAHAGRPAWYRATYVPDVGPDGRVRGLFAMTLNITAQKLAELRRARSEARVVSILTHAPDAFIGLDPDGLINEWNRQAELTFGWTRVEVLGRRLSDLLIPEPQRAAHEAGLRRFMHSGAGDVVNSRIEVMALRRDGAEIPVELSVAAVRDGDRFAANAFLRDISDRRAADARLAASEQRLRTIADNLPVLISYVDHDERMQFVNETYRTWSDVDPVAAIGHKVADVVGSELYAQRRDALKAALAGRRVEFDVVSHARGERRCLHTVYVPDVRDDGRVMGLYALSSDVTALKAVEEKLNEQARVDPLTGLPNRRAFDERLRLSVARNRRNRKQMALLFLDVDHFKQINDTHGHGVGDQVLKEFAGRLLSAVRQTDTVARLAGDEFVIILEGLNDADEASLVAGGTGCRPACNGRR
jgi:PAS domain S-box-containing protein